MEGLNKKPELEAALIFIMSLLTYGMCELPGLNLAAIVAIFVFGIMQSHYNRYNLSTEAVEKAGFTFGLVSYICEAFILIYFGLSFASFFGDSSVFEWELVYYALIEFGTLLLMRFTTVFLLVGIVKLFKKKGQLSLSFVEVVLVAFSGMIRGSIAYALVVKLAPDTTNGKKMILIAQMVIAFTMYIFTPLNPLLFKILLKDQVKGGGESVPNEVDGGTLLTRQPSRTVLLEKRAQLIKKPAKGLIAMFKRADEFFIKPLLIRDYEKRLVSGLI